MMNAGPATNSDPATPSEAPRNIAAARLIPEMMKNFRSRGGRHNAYVNAGAAKTPMIIPPTSLAPGSEIGSVTPAAHEHAPASATEHAIPIGTRRTGGRSWEGVPVMSDGLKMSQATQIGVVHTQDEHVPASFQFTSGLDRLTNERETRGIQRTAIRAQQKIERHRSG